MNKERIEALLEQVLAIETLEYHDMNHLDYDIPRRSLNKQKMLIEALAHLGKMVETGKWWKLLTFVSKV